MRDRPFMWWFVLSQKLLSCTCIRMCGTEFLLDVVLA